MFNSFVLFFKVSIINFGGKYSVSKYSVRDENRFKNIIRRYQLLNHMKS